MSSWAEQRCRLWSVDRPNQDFEEQEPYHPSVSVWCLLMGCLQSAFWTGRWWLLDVKSLGTVRLHWLSSITHHYSRFSCWTCLHAPCAACRREHFCAIRNNRSLGLESLVSKFWKGFSDLFRSFQYCPALRSCEAARFSSRFSRLWIWRKHTACISKVCCHKIHGARAELTTSTFNYLHYLQFATALHSLSCIGSIWIQWNAQRLANWRDSGNSGNKRYRDYRDIAIIASLLWCFQEMRRRTLPGHDQGPSVNFDLIYEGRRSKSLNA